MTVDYVHLCDWAGALIGNKPCIIGAFEQIDAPNGFPVLHPAMAVAVFMTGKPHATGPLRIELTAPTGAKMAEADAVVTLSEKGRGFVTFSFVGMVFDRPGRCHFALFVGAEHLASYPMDAVDHSGSKEGRRQ